MTKICTRCKIEQPIENYGNRIKRDKVVKQTYCKECNKAYHREHFQKNKKTYVDKALQYKKDNQKRLLEYFKDKECKDCGNTDTRVFEFDHLHSKAANISEVMKSWCWERILTEIDKCEIVCCNCHRIRTLVRSNNYRTLAD